MKKLLLVDNDSDTLLELRALCDLLGYDSTTVHCSALADYEPTDFDLIVLSGGYWYDDELEHLERYAKELDLIRQSRTPIVGICLGMQLMQVADSGEVPELDVAQSGDQEITLTTEGTKLLSLPKQFLAHKNHTRGILTALPQFEILGQSANAIEIIKHRTKPLIGAQFHPEIGNPEQGIEIMQALISVITKH